MAVEQQQKIGRRRCTMRVAVVALTLLALAVPWTSSASALGSPGVRKRVCHRPIWQRIRLGCRRGIRRRHDRSTVSITCAVRVDARGPASSPQDNSAGKSVPAPLITGTITLDGVPLPSGTVEWRPVGDGKHAVRAKIRDGRFSIPGATLPPGKYKVQLHTPDPPAHPDPTDQKP